MLSAMTHANVVAIMARALGRVLTRLVVSERSTISMEFNRPQQLIGRVIYMLTPLLYPLADGVVSVSKSAAADLIRFTHLPTSAVEFIYNPFELDRIQALADEKIAHPWFEPGQPPVVLAIGRLNQAKDYQTLIRAFALLHSKGPTSRLLILGEGELRTTLEILVTECGLTTDEVQIPGFVSNPFSYLARCGVFALSSRYEGLPGALIEAMACGAPVVSTDCPSGPREILEDGRWGVLVPVGDVAALAQAIDTILLTPRAQLPDVRQRARVFDLEPAVNAYLKVLGLPRQRITDVACDQQNLVS
jgi:glycosyltransferase involved in cell wall biosynthesis